MSISKILIINLITFHFMLFIAVFIKLYSSKMKTDLLQYIKYTLGILCVIFTLPLIIISYGYNDNFIKKFKKCKDMERSKIIKTMFIITYFYLYDFIDFIIENLIQKEKQRQKILAINKRYKNRPLKSIKDVLGTYFRKSDIDCGNFQC